MPFILKDIFAVYRILCIELLYCMCIVCVQYRLTYKNTQKILLLYFLVCITSNKKSVITLIFVPLYITYLFFFLLTALHFFPFVSSFKQFKYALVCFFFSFLMLGFLELLLNYLDLSVMDFIKFKIILVIISLDIFSVSHSLVLFWGTSITCIFGYLKLFHSSLRHCSLFYFLLYLLSELHVEIVFVAVFKFTDIFSVMSTVCLLPFYYFSFQILQFCFPEVWLGPFYIFHFSIQYVQSFLQLPEHKECNYNNF